MHKFSEPLTMYFIVLTFFLNRLPFFFCPWDQNLPPFRTHLSVIRDPVDKNEMENALPAWQPGLPLPSSFLVACGLSMEIVFSLGSHQWDSHSHGQRRAAPLMLPARCTAPWAFTPNRSHQEREEPSPSSPPVQHGWHHPLLLRQIHQLLWHYLRQKARQDLAPNQRPHQCVPWVSRVSVCSGRAKS